MFIRSKYFSKTFQSPHDRKTQKKQAFSEMILFRMHIETSKDRGTRPTKSVYLPSLKLTVRPGKEPIPKGSDGRPTIGF